MKRKVPLWRALAASAAIATVVALTGCKPGASVTYAAPNGNDITVELLEVKPHTG